MDITNQGKLIIISGPSGAGKGTLCKKILDEYPNFALSISATTRKPGPGEIEGVHYFFLTEEKFKEMIENNEFLEWTETHGHHYGTPKKPVEKFLDEGKDVILEIDVKGGLNVEKIMGRHRCITIFVKAPNEAELLSRIKGRARENEEEIKIRMKTAQWEMAQEAQYDYSVINDDLEVAKDKILEIIKEAKEDDSSTN